MNDQPIHNTIFMQARLFTRLVFRSREVYPLKVLTLAVAFAAFFIVVRFSEREFSYDEFNQQPEMVFRVLERNEDPDYTGNRWSARIPSRVVSLLEGAEGRDSLIVSRMKILQQVSAGVKGGSFTKLKIHMADADITDVLSFQITNGVVGDFGRAGEATVLLSERAAIQLTGTRETAGRRVQLTTYGDTLSARVAAVFKNFPSNTHEDFNIFVRWDSSSLSVLHFDGEESAVYGRSSVTEPSEYVFHGIDGTSADRKYSLQPLPAIYFGPRVLGEEASHGDRYSILILICITALILFLAVATYINLTTLTLPHRAKELAVKKLAGEASRPLLSDFLAESCAMVGVSFVLSLVALWMCTPWWESWLGISPRELFWNPGLAYVAAVVMLTMLVALAPLGLMRRFVQAGPIRLLSSDAITFPRLKSIMGFLQLGVGIFLIVASVVVRRQISYSLLKEPGTNHDQIVYLSCPQGMTAQRVAALRNQWKQTNANIMDVMAVSQLPDRLESKEISTSSVSGISPFYLLYVDPGFRDFFSLEMRTGNWFKANDGDSIIVTNDAGRALLGDSNPNVIGVIEDPSRLFNQPSKPVKIKLEVVQTFNWLCVRVLEVDIRRTVNGISGQLRSNNQPARVQYLDPHFASWIGYQDRLNHMSDALAIISVVLSCISIYGLSVSVVREKTRQIAVHRLFGARTSRLTYLLARAFVVQALVALTIFGPLIYIAVKELLRTFVYATRLQWMDAIYPIVYCAVVISLVCFVQAVSLNRSNFASALKDA